MATSRLGRMLVGSLWLGSWSCWLAGGAISVAHAEDGPVRSSTVGSEATYAAARDSEGVTVVEMVVAQVGGSVITLSELTGMARLVLAREVGPTNAGQAPIDDPFLAAVLETMVNHELVLREVRRLQLPSIPDAELAVLRAQLEAQFSSQEALDAFFDRFGEPAGLSVDTFLVNERQVDRFLSARVESQVTVEAQEVLACFEVNRSRFQDRPISAVRPAIEARILAQKRDVYLVGFLGELRQRTMVWVVPRFVSPVRSRKLSGPFDCPLSDKPYAP